MEFDAKMEFITSLNFKEFYLHQNKINSQNKNLELPINATEILSNEKSR